MARVIQSFPVSDNTHLFLADNTAFLSVLVQGINVVVIVEYEDLFEFRDHIIHIEEVVATPAPANSNYQFVGSYILGGSVFGVYVETPPLV